MNKHIININGKTFVFFLKGRRLDVFMYKNGPQKVDFTTFKNKNQAKFFLTKGIIEMFKREILENIKNKKYTTIESLEKDFKEKLSSIDNPEIKRLLENVKSTKEYENAIKELTISLQKQLDNVDEKKEMIKKTLDLDLKELFERNGITEYEIDETKTSTLIVYRGKDGTPHTIINNNPNISIYDVIVKNLQFDHSKTKEIDNNIQEIMETEAKFTYTENETLKIDKGYYKEINDYILKTRSDINKIYDIKPSNSKIEGALILETNKGFEPIIINRNSNGNLNIEFPNKKEVEKEKTSTNLKQDIKKDTIEEDLNKISNDSEIETTIEKLYKNEYINEDEKNNLKSFITNIYNKLNENEPLSSVENTLTKRIANTDLYDKIIYQIPEIKYICDEIIKINIPKEEIKKEENDKVKKIEPPKDKNAFIELAIATFLSGLISGLFVYTFFKMLF